LATVGDGARIAVVRVDAAEHAAVAGEDIVHDDVTRAAIAAAITARSDNLAIVGCVKVLDVKRSFGSQSISLVLDRVAMSISEAYRSR